MLRPEGSQHEHGTVSEHSTLTNSLLQVHHIRIMWDPYERTTRCCRSFDPSSYGARVFTVVDDCSYVLVLSVMT